MQLILFLIIGGIAGLVAGKIMRGGGFGIVVNMIVGIIGSFIGGFMLGVLGFSAGGLIAQLITAISAPWSCSTSSTSSRAGGLSHGRPVPPPSGEAAPGRRLTAGPDPWGRCGRRGRAARRGLS